MDVLARSPLQAVPSLEVVTRVASPHLIVSATALKNPPSHLRQPCYHIRQGIPQPGLRHERDSMQVAHPGVGCMRDTYGRPWADEPAAGGTEGPLHLGPTTAPNPV